MAKRSFKSKTKKPPIDQPIQDRSFFYSDLAMMPSSLKESKTWCAQSLFQMKLNCVPLVDFKKCRDYRELNLLNIDRQTYVNMIDPPTPLGGGGTAEYFASDFKANPINIHLQNIVRAKLDKIGFVNKLSVNEIDKFSKSQRQKDKDKILHQEAFRDLIKDIIKEIGGMPPISDSETPDEYVNNLINKDGTGKSVDEISRLVQQIQTQVKSSKDYAIYERYVYKGEIERAFELGIQHYLIDQNKWRIKSEYFIDDIRNFNAAVGRAYTDETSGRQIVEYISPDRFFTNVFYEKNGEDIIQCFYEEDIPFAEFVRQFGTTLTDEQLKQVFELNKINGAGHNIAWSNAPTKQRNNALIRIGFASVLTQEAQDSFTEEYMKSPIPTYNNEPLTWQADKDSAKHKQRIYNVWYSFYYVPPPGEQLQRNSQASWGWQSQFIFNIKKDIDMYRYGVDLRYAKSTFVVWKDLRPSFTDIEQAFMPKIHTTWHKFQNCLVQDTTALAMDSDFLTGLLNAVDEANDKDANPHQPTGGNGLDAGMQAWRSLKQGGMGFLKFRDKNGNLVMQDPNKFFVKIDTGHLDKAEKYLAIIIQQYEMLKIALAQNDITEGQTPKPRTPVAAIEASIAASNNAIWFLEKPVREFLIMFGERCVQWQLRIVKDKKIYDYPDRWNEYKDVIGMPNALMVEGIEDLDPEDIGLTVNLEDPEAMQNYVFTLANEMAVNKEVSKDAVALVVDANRFNWKYAMAILMLSASQQEEEMAAKEEIAYQRQMELQQMQLQTATALEGAKTQGKQQEILKQGEVDSALQTQLNQEKYQTQSQLKKETTINRMAETNNKLDKENELENQKTILT